MVAARIRVCQGSWQTDGQGKILIKDPFQNQLIWVVRASISCIRRALFRAKGQRGDSPVIVPGLSLSPALLAFPRLWMFGEQWLCTACLLPWRLQLHSPRVWGEFCPSLCCCCGTEGLPELPNLRAGPWPLQWLWWDPEPHGAFGGTVSTAVALGCPMAHQPGLH